MITLFILFVKNILYHDIKKIDIFIRIMHSTSTQKHIEMEIYIVLEKTRTIKMQIALHNDGK